MEGSYCPNLGDWQCTITGSTAYEYIRVKLSQPSLIQQVRVQACDTSLYFRFRELTVGNNSDPRLNQHIASFTAHTPFAYYNIDISPAVVAEYVAVYTTDTEPVQLAQIIIH